MINYFPFNNYEHRVTNLLRDHVFRFLLNLLIVALHNTCSEILNLLLLSFKQHAFAFVRSAHSCLSRLCDRFGLFVSL